MTDQIDTVTLTSEEIAALTPRYSDLDQPNPPIKALSYAEMTQLAKSERENLVWQRAFAAEALRGSMTQAELEVLADPAAQPPLAPELLGAILTELRTISGLLAHALAAKLAFGRDGATKTGEGHSASL